MKTALITGATSGIGKATAQALAPNHRLILCGRNTANLAAIQDELAKITEVTTLTFDVSDKKATFDAIATLPANWQTIDVLINNAGNAHGLATFQEASLDDLEAMIDINVKGIIYVTKALLPLMMGKGSGHIVNLSSIAGKEAYQNGTIYCASKAAVEAFSKGLRYDLLSEGIKVTNVAPGAVETDFSLVRFKGDSDRAAQVYQGYTPLVAEDIANAIAYIINQPEHVQIADITVFPKAQAGATTIHKKM
ncbi:SDR family NAD(P)-dependent oxidoreductase [Myroides marinus]|uniref:NADP-dependent 3-hydroxy acid dehydrogenase YdfG n=1 Tax=Myroides marinus TaxID=703342 RepID=A0A1H6TJA5_9FLAO|nr:SDR family NAD(P)-dependent oxidoreductase [Myroides marinus]MDM1346919.1 SDR family NAD(P)-dependent oxidoreductase [Myroides marinus]MDM1350397.1 SDR family NAD(P)-dependent oxidoreductase [Myroides marinus]MDM1354197.1 SDR family NAD(P)-dependent oxidoreductase [Myroides marinus]MDM1357604.1 SDR family NAD(P)-dependent oxidoreductase [Myroides marinus]MDM1361618.1 SDR family NAD(P)-dependent oxidoreductase [Myroides marinus]